MSLQVIYSNAPGSTTDLSGRVFMASEHLGLPGVVITQNAEEGSVAHFETAVDDPTGTLTLKGHRRVYYVETSAPAGAQVIGNGFLGTKTVTRGSWAVGPLARTYTAGLADSNTLISRRLVVGADGARPAETDVQRVQWLMTTTEANQFNGSATYINTSGPVAMDAVDYRGQSVEGILNDCSQASGKNYWVIYEESLGEFSLWYDWDYSATYSSTIRLSNDEADVDDSTTFAYFPDAKLSQDPSRVYSGVLIDFMPASSETTSWVYETNLATGNEFVFRDVSYPSQNVKTEAKARARAQRYLGTLDEEEDVIHVSFVVPAAAVNKLMHGHRIEMKGTHWGFEDHDYTTFTWMRAMNRTVTQIGPAHYQIDAELSPIRPTVPCPESQTNVFAGTQSFDVFIVEIANVHVSPADSGSLVGQDLGVTPYQTDVMTPGIGTSSILVAGWVFDNEGDTDTGVTSATLTILNDQPNCGSPGSAPEKVFGYQLIPNAAGSYQPVVVSSPSPFNEYGESRGWASSAAVFIANGGTPTIVQSKNGCSTGGVATITLDSVPTSGNVLVAFLAARNSPGNLAATTSGWTQMDMINAFRAGPSAHNRYGRLMWKEVCPDG